MGHNPTRKPIVERSRELSSGTITSLMTTGVPHIYSHQQVDDHHKGENHTYKTHNKQQKGKLEPKNDFIMKLNILSQSTTHISSKHVMNIPSIHYDST